LSHRGQASEGVFEGVAFSVDEHQKLLAGSSLLDERSDDPWFRASGDPYHLYGGKSLHRQSHGEAFLQVVKNRFGKGIYLLDEPESALSPQRQVALLTAMSRLVATRSAQFIVATHSPILMTFPGANILSFDDPALPSVRFDETEHFRLTRDFLNSPDLFWRQLTRPEEDG
jgi:predicted ATPase